MMNKMAMNKMKHEKDMAALDSTCQIFSNDLAGSYSCEDTASQCFYASFQVST
jgi:hypothetical protein